MYRKLKSQTGLHNAGKVNIPTLYFFWQKNCSTESTTVTNYFLHIFVGLPCTL
jgi:hypothetical protein